MGAPERVQSKDVVLGYIAGVYGVKGWVKVFSHTKPTDNILNYTRWTLRQNRKVKSVEVSNGRRQGKGLVAHIAGCNDRDAAHKYIGAVISVTEDQLPPPADDEVYWHQLEGLSVYVHNIQGGETLLGKVKHLMETGANDVMVVAACEGSVDQRERLLPWLTDEVILDIDLASGRIRVDWDPEF